MLVGLPEFDYLSCETLEEACSLLSRYAGISRVLAGGTDLFVKMKHRRVIPRYLINIKKIPGLNEIRYDRQLGLRIGALTSIQEIKDSTLIREHFPILSEAAGKLGTTHIRNLGTLGGNLANASPAAEFAPSLLTLGASVQVVGSEGERTLSLEDFFIAPGKAAIRFDEILTEIRIPNQRLDAGIYLKYGTRPMDVAIVNLALTVAMDGEVCKEIKIALGAVAPTPFRARRAEDVIRGTRLSGALEPRFQVAAQIAVEESKAISDFRATAACRTGLIEALIMEALERAVRGAKST